MLVCSIRLIKCIIVRNLAIKLKIFLLLLSILHFSAFADNPPLYSFDKAEIKLLNANTLADIIHNIPLVNVVQANVELQANLGTEDFEVNAIYKDGYPLFLDQNVEGEYRAVSLADIERIEIRWSDIHSSAKGTNTINIYLFTQSINEKPSEYSISLMSTYTGDVAITANTKFSDTKHSFGMYFSRYFEDGEKLDAASRRFDLPSFTNHYFGMSYTLRFVRNASLSVNYNAQVFNLISRNAMIPATSRTTDFNDQDMFQHVNGKLNARLSKTHKLEISAQYAFLSHYHFEEEKDLSNGKSEILAVSSLLDSVANRQMMVKSLFSKTDSSKNYSYSLGVSYSHFKDVYTKSINAISVSYSDYVLEGKVEYKPSAKFYIGGGVDYLSNSSMGNYVLPRLSLVVKPSTKLHLEFRQTSSVFYPQNTWVFYSAEKRNSIIENNLNLRAGQMDISHFLVQIHEKKAFFESGFIAANIKNGIKADYVLSRYVNGRQASSLTTYVAYNMSSKGFSFNPVLAVNGHNEFKNALDRNSIFPEFNLKTSYRIIPIQLAFFANFRVVGESRRLMETESGFIEQRLDQYNLINLAVSKTLWKDQLSLYLGVNNVLNAFQTYINVYSLSSIQEKRIGGSEVFFARQRTIFMSLKLQLK